jgi:pimeloyl-ACP methyl ester carboxylesterase
MLRSETIDLAGGRQPVIYHAGEGPPLVWLHGLNGVEQDAAIVTALASKHHVIAPLAPGFNDLDELQDLRDIHDLALHYDDILDHLHLDQATLIGHSFGAMIAAEVAAHVPARVKNLVLISPLGLWNDRYPVADLFAVPSTDMPSLLFVDPQRAAPPSANGSNVDVERLVTLVRGMTTVARFLWPIPDRGLSRRLRRIKAQTLIIHGERDAFVPAQYARDFATALPTAKLRIINAGGHMLPTEFPEQVLHAIEEEMPL